MATDTAVTRAAERAPIFPELTQDDMTRLLRWGWKYNLELLGFTPAQAQTLIFCRYLADTGRLVG